MVSAEFHISAVWPPISSNQRGWGEGMGIKFRHKVFLAFLLNSLSIVVCILSDRQLLAERHFREYISKFEAERITKLVDQLAQEYMKGGNWDSVLEDPGFWFAWGG